MGKFVASKVIKHDKEDSNQGFQNINLRYNIQENCPDVRNTKVIDIRKELISYNTDVDVYDPVANKNDVLNEFEIKLKKSIKLSNYQAIILCVSHNEFEN